MVVEGGVPGVSGFKDLLTIGKPRYGGQNLTFCLGKLIVHASLAVKSVIKGSRPGKKPVSLTLPLLCQIYGEGKSPPTRFDI